MRHQLLNLVESWWWMAPLWVATFIVGLLVMRWLILRIPADHFVRQRLSEPPASATQRRRQIVLSCLKNGGGLVLLVTGLVMLVTPGPGLLALVLGLSLIDFPGKRRLEERLLCQPRVLHAANRLRERHGVEPLVSPRELVPS
jgi:hypothetical protein